jgi:hypothetical protein
MNKALREEERQEVMAANWDAAFSKLPGNHIYQL